MGLKQHRRIGCTIDQALTPGAAACLSCGEVHVPEPDDVRTEVEPDGGPYRCDACGLIDLYGITGLITEDLVDLGE